jgi:hypothetical protein
MVDRRDAALSREGSFGLSLLPLLEFDALQKVCSTVESYYRSACEIANRIRGKGLTSAYQLPSYNILDAHHTSSTHLCPRQVP